MRILKFGGTSVGSVTSIGILLSIIRKHLDSQDKIAVVTSAMGGVTNMLLEIAKMAENGQNFSPLLKQIENKHLEVIHAMIEVKKQNPAIMQLKLFFNELEELLYGVKAVKELSAKTLDLVMSYGERCSTFMIAVIIRQYYSAVTYVDAREWIKTDSEYGNAKVNFELTNVLIQQYYQSHPNELCCITGFIASNEKGQTTTLGRGGSDYSASIVGAALQCEEIQIWTDVDGFMTADPRMVKKAFTLPEISYTEAMELSYFGAKVIYPPTMIPVFLKKIPIIIRNTFNPDFPGTVIKESVHRNGTPIRGISSINRISLINVEGSGLVGKTGFSGRLFSLLARENINIILITQASSEHSITLAVTPENAEKARILIEQEFELELLTQKMERPVIEVNLSILAIVGENMKQTKGLSGKLFSALGRNGVNVVAIAQGSSEYNISVVIREHDLSKALNAVHDAFFITTKKTLNVFYLGVGNIGKTLLQQIASHEDYLLQHNSLKIKIVGITNTRNMLFAEEGIKLKDWNAQLQEHGEKASLQKFMEKMKSMNLPNSVFIDNSASAEVVKYYQSIFEASISVVTCNKIGNSGEYSQYKQFKTAVKKYGVDFFYETNVGAGLPIISTLRDLLVSGDKILKIEAILSGTISYIFNEFKGERHFYDIVKEAQEKGFTEPDPRDDLSGLDFTRKMLILARDSGYTVEMKEVEIQQILPDKCLQAPSIEAFYDTLKEEDAHFEKIKKQAEKQDKLLRYIGVMEEGKVSIRLEAIDASHPFYSLSGSDNIIAFVTTRYKDCPLVVKGPGAGAEVTAAGVFADLVKVGAQ
jgi:bifunctional aspartokinase / homoserine dehydrogenase 1